MNDQSHVPVLHSSAVQALQINPGGVYVDATYGRGGHTQSVLNLLNEKGRLLALDRDPEAIADANKKFGNDQRFSIVQSNFADLTAVIEQQGLLQQVDGLLLDLGVSSPQLDVAERGFSFSQDGELDMRMDPTTGLSATQWLAQVKLADLIDVLRTFGEERYSKRIATAIVNARDEAPITRTGQLAEIVKQAHPRWERHHHPATRTFQGIRIFINGELDAVSKVLASAPSVLKQGARIVVISFHSLEDRLVKRAFRAPMPPADFPRHLPLPEMAAPVWKALGKAVKANEQELSENPRARSAVMRVAVKL